MTRRPDWCGRRLDAHLQLLGQEPERLRELNTLVQLALDEQELIHLGPGILALRALAPGRTDRAVPLLPRAQRGGRDPEHPRHRANAIGGRLRGVSHLALPYSNLRTTSARAYFGYNDLG